MATALKEGVEDLLELCRSAAPRNRSAHRRIRHRSHRGAAGGCGERGVRRAIFCGELRAVASVRKKPC